MAISPTIKTVAPAETSHQMEDMLIWSRGLIFSSLTKVELHDISAGFDVASGVSVNTEEVSHCQQCHSVSRDTMSLTVTRVDLLQQRTEHLLTLKSYKSSAVAEMGDRAHNRHGPKR